MMEVKTTPLAMSVPNSQPLVLLQVSCTLSYLAGFWNVEVVLEVTRQHILG